MARKGLLPTDFEQILSEVEERQRVRKQKLREKVAKVRQRGPSTSGAKPRHTGIELILKRGNRLGDC